MAASKVGGSKKSDNKVRMDNDQYPAVVSDVWLRYTDDNGHSQDAQKRAYTGRNGANPGTQQRCKFVFELDNRHEVLDIDVAVLFGDKSNYTKIAGWFGYDVNVFDPEAQKGAHVKIMVDCTEKTVQEGAGKGARYWWSRVIGIKPTGQRSAQIDDVDDRRAYEQQSERLNDITEAQQREKAAKIEQITRITRAKGIASREEFAAKMTDLCEDLSFFHNLPGVMNTLSKYTLAHLTAYADDCEKAAAKPAPAEAAPAAIARPTGGMSAIQASIINTTFDALFAAGKINPGSMEQVIAEMTVTGNLKTATAAEAKAIIGYLTSLNAAA